MGLGMGGGVGLRPRRFLSSIFGGRCSGGEERGEAAHGVSGMRGVRLMATSSQASPETVMVELRGGEA